MKHLNSNKTDSEMVKLNGILKSEQSVLVEFFAKWCPHCQRMNPIVAHIEQAKGDNLKIERYDIDAPQNKELLNYYRIQSIPTFLLFHDGDQVWRQSGEMSENQLDEIIQKFE